MIRKYLIKKVLSILGTAIVQKDTKILSVYLKRAIAVLILGGITIIALVVVAAVTLVQLGASLLTHVV